MLAKKEERLIKWLLRQIPGWVTPDTLTIVGVVGAVIGSIGLIASNWSDKWVVLTVIGVLLHWFGDSLDGSLARHRGIERPRVGFMIDHACDLFSNVFLIIGFGLSPYLSIFSALIVLQCYLLFSAYSYLGAAVYGVHHMAYARIGATEFRLIMIMYATLSIILQHKKPFSPGYSIIDIIIVISAVIATTILAVKAYLDAKKLAIIEQRHSSE